MSPDPVAQGRRGVSGERRAHIRERFVDAMPFPLDDFQVRALDALDAGRSVLVAAPTGAGKTLVASYAVETALGTGTKAFYTTPLKALSNQKYAELVATHGETMVGLLTGDTAKRPDAPVVVMTTEVLRNMLLAGSDLLRGLSTVILDEVHYLQDPYRGGVWEEVLVLSPPELTFVCLSATVNNATELGDWLRSVRGPTDVVVERHRPITLRHHFALHSREDQATSLIPLLDGSRPAEEGLRVDHAVGRAMRGRQSGQWYGHRSQGPPLPFKSPRRTELLELLDDESLLPAIVFIFSRAACDDAVRQVLRDGLRLASRSQRGTIRAIAEAHVTELSDEDLTVHGYDEWREGLEAGVAAHHAGMVPAFREAVEACFSAGLLKAVFATETLSLGINMPARTVVIERFTKFGGAGRAPLTSGEYAQLTGRAGRRGLDEEGHAVVLWTPETTFAEVARIAVAPPPDLRSSFRPTYNLAVNLVRHFDRETALQVLRRSFAQWQANANPARGGRDLLAEHLGRRLAVLEELGYVRAWSLTEPGRQLAGIYHEADLLLAEAVTSGVLDDTEPAVLAGVLSSLVFERRRAKKPIAHAPRRHRTDRRTEERKAKKKKGAPGDRLGEQRRAELADRLGVLVTGAERIRGTEEVHLVPRTRSPEVGLAGAVTSWARGASFATVLEVAALDVGEMAPGDFVRAIKQLADLVGQVAMITPNPATAAAAQAAVGMLVRNVVAAGGLAASATEPSAQF